MRAGLARALSVPRALLDGRDVSIDNVAGLDDPEQSAFWKPFEKMPASIPEAEQEQLRADVRKAIGEQLIPAFGKLLTFFREEYVPNARDTLAAEAMPGGEAWYRQQIREYTTLELDPEENHAIGLREVDRIQREKDDIIRKVGLDGDIAHLLTFMRTHPQFSHRHPAALQTNADCIPKT